jgi:phage terminase large subunit GpA-like protein
MDEGAKVAWPARHYGDEISALQHAMNLKLRDEEAFYAEYQNEPVTEQADDEDLLTADELAAKVNGLAKGRVPLSAEHLTCFIDVQDKALFWLVAAWAGDFTGSVIDYGIFPDQKRRWFSLRDVQRTLARHKPGADKSAQILAGLNELADDLLTREWAREDGAHLKIGRCLVDAGHETDTIFHFCRRSPHAALLMPAFGRYVGAANVPFSEYKRQRGERLGHHWRIPSVSGKRTIRHVLTDVNYWKSFIQARLAALEGNAGALMLYGRKPNEHRLIAAHLTAEHRIRTQGRGRTVDEWKLPPSQPDNHWLDCLVGASVAASMQGASLASAGHGAADRPRRRLKLSEIQAEKRG